MNRSDERNIEQLIDAVLLLDNAEEARSFLRDLLTQQELVEFGKRLEAARMLNEKESYNRIETATGLSSTTIARISKWLQTGRGGYHMILSRLSKRASRR